MNDRSDKGSSAYDNDRSRVEAPVKIRFYLYSKLTRCLMNKLKTLFKVMVKPKGYAQIVRQIPTGGLVLDVGCGNNSPAKLKHARPDIYYIGLDVSDHNQAVAPETIA